MQKPVKTNHSLYRSILLYYLNWLLDVIKYTSYIIILFKLG